MKSISCLSLLAVALVWHGSVPQASAASISAPLITRVTTLQEFNLSSLGDVDWALWGATTNPTNGVPSAEKVGGTLIGSLSQVGGTAIRGTPNSTTLAQYTYADAASAPNAASKVSAGGLIFNTSLGSSGLNRGVQLSLTATSTADRYVSLFLGGFGATGTLTLTLSGVTTVVDATQVFGPDGPKQIAVYSFKYNADNVGDVLNVSYVASAITDTTNGHVGFQAAAVSAFPQVVVPEPSVAVLGGLGAAFLGLRRRRAGIVSSH